ncbi:MAG: DMT family transporter [Candidatus Caldatribacteriota bacterium]|nr:DMT family transporter [Candidatus Caldatribacteriota bacterium]
MMIIATICFSAMALMVKYLRHYPLMEIIFFRNLAIMLIVPPLLRKNKIPLLGNNKFLLVFRSILSGIIMACYFYTVTAMNLTDAITLKQLSPFFIIILASIWLGEKITLKQCVIFIFAFLGALLIIKPGFRLDILPAIIGIIGAMLTAGSHTSVRSLRLTDHPLVIVNYFGYIIGLISLGILLFQGNFIFPDIFGLFILFLLGIFGLGAQIAMTKAYQFAPAKLVSLYLYLDIIFGTFLAFLFFKEIPDIFSIFGALLIIASGYLNFKYSKKERKNV